ncbi:MAG: DNA cytosine methyltransferase [Odoribacteraceae bacterium]|jgi:DNA (cytosine-5)-methyltransferase 1|nr:DNA cytosine methyltransferase [Odoribacteraceae bacterium]
MENIRLLYIDLFCGAGGTSTGVESATYKGEKCAKVIACVNHDANAIASHAANHPDALHFTEDIRTLELSPLLEHVEEMKAQYPDALVVLWASLECTNFSKAKGGKPRDADSRTLAEHLYRYIAAINPDYIQIENVAEFMSWGDLGENGKPVSCDSGRLYHKWVNTVKDYGYDFSHRILNAADYGAYTSIRRFFGQFAKCRLPIIWPEPTHAKKQTSGLFGQLKKWKPVKDVLDFADDGESIFMRKKPLSDKTLERIYAGLVKFVAGGNDKWLLKYNSINGVTGKHVPPSVDEPCPVIGCQDRLGILQTQFLSKYYSGHPDGKNFSVEEPAHTVTPIDHHSLVSASFIQQRNTGNPEHKIVSVERPSRTITATGGNQELVQPVFLARYNGQPKQDVNAVSVEVPSPTLTTIDRLALVTPNFIVNEYSGGGQHASIDDTCPAVLTQPKQKVVQCKFIDQQFGNSHPSSIEHPLGCITANPKYNLVTCHTNRYYLMNPQFSSEGGSIDNPCFTLIARMDKRPPYLVMTEAGQLAIEVHETDSEPMKRIKEFMALYGIVDIKMRMLRIPELKRIMGFPEDYVLIGSKAEQKKYIGNAVEVNMARVLCEALCLALINKYLK